MSTPTVEQLEAERLRPTRPRRRIHPEDLAELLAEAYPPPLNPRRFENYRFCRDHGETPETAARRTGITGDFDRARYERRYLRTKNGDQ